MKISVVIPIYLLDPDLLKITDECIESLRVTGKDDYELIIVDNNSPIPKQYKADIYIKNKTNLGNGVAWKQGMRVATGDYILLSDNDVIFNHGWQKMTKMADDSIVFPLFVLDNTTEWRNDCADSFG